MIHHMLLTLSYQVIPFLTLRREYDLEPRTAALSIRKLTASQLWPIMGIVSSVAGKIRILNLLPEPHFPQWIKHFCLAHPIYTPEAYNDNPQLSAEPPPKPQVGAKHSSDVHLDPYDLLPCDISAKFTPLLDEYDHVFGVQ